MPYKPPTSEPIAVVASSCRFTGGVTSPSKLWDLLKQPFDVSRTVPPSRFNVQAFFHQDGDYHGTTNAPNAYWLDDDQDVCAFDAGFFGIAPKEAEAVDPQQRLLLETVFEAIESAGYQLPQWAGKDVAVYVGAMTADFDTVSQRDDLSTSPYYATGNARSILSNRISYFYNFHGPSITIDTACSSSLVALHQAVLGLRAGDCSAACVAGVNVMLSPEQFLVESSLNMLSPTGHCHMWDSRADGYARGEGAAVLLLKPLSRALADGDGFRIQAIIRETGVGSDGRTAGITMPSPVAQASLICATYRRAGLDISDWDDRCQYFEAHGTGTPVGDPREAEAIYTAFFGKRNFDAKPDSTCTGTAPKMLVGSVKTVIGHTEGAAGLAGLLKVMLAMKHSKVAPNLHFERLNPQVAPYCTPTAQGFLHIPTQLVDWPPVASGQPLRASVNSFGFGGTNAHAIVERYDPVIHSPHYYFHRIDRLVAASTGVKSLPQIPLVLSAKSVSSLRILAKKYLDLFQLQENVGSESDYQEVAWLTHASKTLFLHRLAVCGQSRADAISILTDLLSDTPSQPKSFGCRAQHIEGRPDDNKPQVLGVFTGQGAQWAGMSRHLFLVNQVYRQSIRFLDSVLECCPDPPEWTLEEELLKLDADGSRLGEAAIAQPVSTALQIGLVNVLHQLGVHFTCVIGHSSGEIAAAYAAKSISARDAILIAYYRGKSTSTPSTAPARLEKDRLFGMLAVGMSFDNAHAFCEAFGSHLCVAASNSPSSSTLSGDMEAIQEAERQLKAKGIFCRRLRVDKAYHSQYMTDFSAWYSNALKSCHLSPLDRPVGCGQQTTWISSVGSDRRTPNTEQLAGSYWVDNMVRPVRFREATEEALQHGAFDCVVEVGPHFALKGPFLDTFAQFNTTRSLRAESLPYKSLLQRGKNDALSFLEFLGFALTQFDPALVDLHGILDDGGREQLAESLSRIQDADTETLPPYPWDHSQKFYRESRITRQFHHKQEPPHELLGSRTRDDAEGHELRWRNMLRVDKIPWLAHHAFQGQPLLPASAYCIMALDAAKSLLAGREASVIELQDVQFHRGVPLEIEGTATEIMFSLFVNHHPAGSLTEDQDKDLISCSFTLYFCSESLSTSLQKCCTGRVHIVLGSPSANALPRRVPPSRQPEVTRVSTDAFYDMMANVGLQYSGPFKSIESMHRRHNFATATLERIHKEDTSRLPWSPATLDSCLQTCFASYSSPGDGSLWTVFLPITIQRISFNMACGALSNITSSLQGTQLSVDAQLVRVRQATPDSPANITGDISIYNDTGDMEICVEGLTVGSLAPSDADTDRELYLYTRYAPDPEFALIQDGAIFDDTNVASGICERVLKESVERIKAFYKSTPEWASIWPAETEDSLNQHIFCSPYSFILEQVRACIKGSSDDHKGSVLALDELFPLHSLIEEGRHSFRFRRHTARIIKQIAHKYPRMSIFSLTDSTMGMSTEILRGLGSAFASYTSVVLGELEKDFDATLSHAPKTVRSRVSRVAFAQTGDIKTQLDSFSERAGQPYDLAILSTSIFKQATSGEAVLERLRFLMRPGGFLILINMPVRMARDLDQQPVLTCKSIFTPPDWPDLLDQHGFINPATKNTDQHYPGGFSITVRRNASQPTMPGQILPSPVSVPVPVGFNAEDRLLILGGRSSTVSLLAAHIGNLLSKHFKNLPVVISGLDEVAEVSTEHLPFFNNIILLSDLDESSPILSSLDEYRLGALRKLISRPESTILWVTEGSRTGNAESTASFGFTRSIRAEMPGLVLQMLDFDILKVAGDHAIALKLAHFGEDATIVSFLPREHSVSRRLSGIMLWNPASHLWSDALEDTGRHTREIRHCHLEDLQQAWDDVQRLAASGHSFDLGADFVSVTGLLNLPGNISHSLKIVDWRVERLVGSKALSHGAFQNTVRENDEGQAIKLRADKTYVLIGITRDMGQSLSMLLIRQGAQHIVLASRTAVNSEPQWAKYARSIVGVHIQFEILDVTDLAAVKQFRARVEQRMPQIGGIVNGAMVLEDRVFAQMTAETFSRVMRPKTVGSRNLDTVFHDDEDQDDNKLDFFIMMSSFAAIGGHAGQCNYSAANMFMNGIAADRQRRGVAGFALNIGVVYGLGFLHREKEHLYTGLEREGYPPISERDLHHMFLEAIAHGRPKAYQSACNQPITELTAGLSRFNPKQAAEDALHWHKDPRFSHFTIEDNDSAGKSPIDGRTSSRTDRSNFKQLVDVINDDKSTAETISQHLVVALSDRLAALLHLSPATGSDGAGKSSKNCGSICKDSSMADLGVDSLVAVQVRTWLWRTTGRDVSVMKILIAPSIDIFCNEIAGKIAAERVKQTS
ncbi:Type I Iterative PKS [Sporothrix epigloea]|uniref:Type I Iterative PKS n=1 Tax=Sporothrix epigloea TaxID=1892477 RepID=A0ABP0DR77_9PEZI